MAGADPAEFGERGLAEDDGAGFAQTRDGGRILLDQRIGSLVSRPRRVREALEPDVVFNVVVLVAVGGADGLALLPARFGGLCRLQARPRGPR